MSQGDTLRSFLPVLLLNVPAAVIIVPFSVKTFVANSVPAYSDLSSTKVKNWSMRLRASAEMAVLGQLVFFRASLMTAILAHM